MAPKPPMPTAKPDELIDKLERKVAKNLNKLQGGPVEDDGDDDDIDEATMNDLLHGERARELDNFLKAH